MTCWYVKSIVYMWHDSFIRDINRLHVTWPEDMWHDFVHTWHDVCKWRVAVCCSVLQCVAVCDMTHGDVLLSSLNLLRHDSFISVMWLIYMWHDLQRGVVLILWPVQGHTHSQIHMHIQAYLYICVCTYMSIDTLCWHNLFVCNRTHSDMPMTQFYATWLTKYETSQYGTWLIPYKTWLMTHSIWDMTHSIWDMTHSIWDMTHSTWDMTHDSFKMRHVSFNIRHDSFKMGHDSFNMGHDSFHMGQDSFSIQKPRMGWLRLVGSLKLWVAFAKEPYKRDYILQKRPIILRSLLIVATP